MKYNVVILFFFVGFLYAQSQKIGFDILLNEITLKNKSINTKLINSIDYTPNGFLLLASSNQFYMLGLEDIPAVFNNTKIAINAFTITQDEALWVVSDDNLCFMDSTGTLSTLYNLPISKAGITSGIDNNIAYIYDRTFQSGKKEYAIYRISDSQYRRLASSPAPILSAYEYKTSLLFSSENKILCADNKTKTFFDLFTLPQKQDIISITGDTINHAIYFSTQDTIYRIKDGILEYISKEFGGIVKYDGEGLLVFNPEKQLIIRFRNNILYPSINISKKEDLPQLKLSIDKTAENGKILSLLNKPRTLILDGKIQQAIQIYAQLANQDNANSTVLLEYAYVLALGGVYDGALVNLDKAKLSGKFSKNDYFFAGQIYALMGYNRPAIEYLTNSSVPKWIYPKYYEMYNKYKSNSSVYQVKDLEIEFERANYLVANDMDFQSIAIYEQLLEEYPDEYLFHVGYSIPLEKTGLQKLAANEMTSGISCLPDDLNNKKVKQAFEERLNQLKSKKDTKQIQQPKPLGMKSQGMFYIGGMTSNTYASLNSRFGLFLTNSFNASIDFGAIDTTVDTYYNLGLSAYQRLGIIVLGIGLNKQFGDRDDYNLKPSIGLSFINKKRTSSWDFFFDIYYPMTYEANYIYGFSIGKSFYFGKRK